MFFKSKNAFNYAFEGENFLLLKNYKKALNSYNKAIDLAQKEQFPNIDLYFSSRATIKKHLGLLEEALIDINKAIDIQPKVYLYYFERSEIKELLNDTKGAQEDIKTISEILEANGSSHVFKIFLAREKAKQNKLAEAEKLLDQNNDPRYNTEPILLLKLKIHEKLNQYEKLLNDLNNLIEIFPLKTVFFEHKAEIQMKIDDFDGALETIEKALAKEPHHCNLHLLKAIIMYKKDEYQSAKEELKIIENLTPSEEHKKIINSLTEKLSNI